MNMPSAQSEEHPQIVNADLLYEIAEKTDTKIRLFPKDWEDERQEIESAAIELAKLWENRPFKNTNGLGTQGALTLFYYMKKLSPKLVMEIGTWRGFSTWIIEQAINNAEIITADPVFALQQFMDKTQYEPTYRSPKVQYTYQDFSVLNINISEEQAKDSVIFFDDHQDKTPRLVQASQKGFKKMLFDDNLPFPYTHQTFQNIFGSRENIERVFNLIKTYEMFPPAYTSTYFRNESLRLEGLDVPKDGDFSYLYEEHQGYSWITYVELK